MAWYPPAPSAYPAQRYTAHPKPRPRFLAPRDAAPPPSSHHRDSRFSAAPRHHDSSRRERASEPDERSFDRRRLHHDDDGARPWWEDERDEAVRAGRRREERERRHGESSRSSFKRRGGHELGEGVGGGGGTRREAPRSATRPPHYLPTTASRLPARPPTALRVRPATNLTDPLVHLPTSLAASRRALATAIAYPWRSRSTEAVPLRGPSAPRADTPRPERAAFATADARRETAAKHTQSMRAPLEHMLDERGPISARTSRRVSHVASPPRWQARPALAAVEQRAPPLPRLERSSSRSRARDDSSRVERGAAPRERNPGSSRSHPLQLPLPSAPLAPAYLPRTASSPLPPRAPPLPPSAPPPSSATSQPRRLPSRLSSPSDPSPPWLADALYGPTFVEVEQWFADERAAVEGVVREVEGEVRRAKRGRDGDEEKAGGGGKRRRVAGGELEDGGEEEMVWLDLRGWEARWRRKVEQSGGQVQLKVRTWR